MKAVILVGGKATRLLPLTCNIPKAIVPVLNIPFLEHVIRHLSRHGIKDIILAQGHLSQSIEGYIDDGSRLGVRISCVVEDTPMGTAGAIKNAAGHLDEAFLALNGDIFTDLDITAMISFHRERKARATISLAPVDDPTSYGLIETDARSRITRFLEKPEPHEVTTNLINAGTYILEPDVLDNIPPERSVSIERETFQELLAQNEPMYAYSSSAYWLDMGTPEKYLQLHRDLLGGKCRNCVLSPTDEVIIGEGSDIHPTAQITGAVVIGANCSIGRGVKLTGPVVIGDDSTILEGSVIEDSVIWHHARIGAMSSVKGSILAGNCRLLEESACEEAVLGDNVTVASGSRVKPGDRIQPGTVVET